LMSAGAARVDGREGSANSRDRIDTGLADSACY
jgi:hypothetical protein